MSDLLILPLIRWKQAGWILAAIFGFIAAASAYGHMLIGLNNDHLTLLDQAQQMLHGATPYVDYTDVSPPLIHLLYAIPLALAAATGIKTYIALNLFTLAIIVASLLLASRLLAYSTQSKLVRTLILSSIAFALLFASFIHQLFADREHLMLCLITPWLLLYSPRVERAATPRLWRWLAALLAAIGFALKPYFYIFYLATLVSQLKSQPRRHVIQQHEHHIVWAFAFGYALTALAFFSHYFTDILPLGWHTYGTISSPFADKLSLIAQELLGGYGLAGLLGALLLWLTAPALFTGDIVYLLILLAACILSVFLNGGWEYTQYPFMAVALLLSLSVTIRLIIAARQLPDPAKCQQAQCAAALLFLIATAHFYLYPAAGRAMVDIAMQKDRGRPIGVHEMVAPAEAKANIHLHEKPRFLLLSTNLWNVDLQKEGTSRKHIGRFDYLWPLPALLLMETDPNRQEAYRKWSSYLTNGLAQDIAKGKPDMIIVDRSPVQRSLPPFFPLLDWLKKSAAFAAAWEPYQLVEIINVCNPRDQADCAYDIYYHQ